MMNKYNSAESDPAQKGGDTNRDRESSDFMVGLATFIVFIVFMTAWMYFGVST